MSIITQSIFTVGILKDNPNGLSIEELAEKLIEKHGNHSVTRFLVHGGDYSLLKEKLKELICIDERNGKYFFNQNAKRYSENGIANAFLKGLLESKL
ncbi:hypothetical protein HYX15_03545 [Candidatus Woesearchaeota archaeon]|nr:hypothetical protein [Candidatus Woesearchaeota archaeon]